MPLLSKPARHPRFAPLRVAEVKEVADRAVSIGFDVSDPGHAAYLDYVAGQYVTLDAEVAGERVRQSYSLWTRPARAREEGLLKVAVTEISGGRMSPWLVSTVEPGVTIGVLPPLGEFTYLPTAGAARHAVVAGGSGITPVLAIMAEILAADEATSVDLLLANRTRDSAVLRDEVTALVESSGHRLRVIDVLSREQVRGVRHARIDADLLDQVWGGEESDIDGWWLCGPEGLLQTAETWIGGRDVDPARVHRERFTRTGPVDPRPDPRSRGLSRERSQPRA